MEMFNIYIMRIILVCDAYSYYANENILYV